MKQTSRNFDKTLIHDDKIMSFGKYLWYQGQAHRETRNQITQCILCSVQG